MKHYAWLGIFLCSLLFGGCAGEQIEILETTTPLQDKYQQTIELYLEEEVTPAPYEPQTGVYLGAYVEQNIDLDNDITQLEEILNHEQAFRVFQYTATQKITPKDILACIANKKIPYIKLLATDEKDLMVVYQLIGDVYNTYHTPVFIELFPLTEKETDPIAYQAYYQDAYQLIKRYLKTAVVVWSVDYECIDQAGLYYPGSEQVDWAGINIYWPKYKNQQVYQPDIETNFDYWYKTYQKSHPLLISGLAVSHFSQIDHTYTLENTLDKLSVFYEKMVFDYPRLKGILYIDVNMKQIYKEGTEDYRISSQTLISSYMKNTVQNSVFLGELTDLQLESPTTAYIKYTVPTLVYNDTFYLEKEHALNLFGKSEVSKIYTIEDVDGTRYCDLKALLKKQSGYYVP
jgi:hypothetical protein